MKNSPCHGDRGASKSVYENTLNYKDSKMRELTFNEVDMVSGGGFFQYLFPSTTAQFSRNPIGGSPQSQVMYGNSVNLFRNRAASTAVFFGPKGVDFSLNYMFQQAPRFIFPDPYNY